METTGTEDKSLMVSKKELRTFLRRFLRRKLRQESLVQNQRIPT